MTTEEYAQHLETLAEQNRDLMKKLFEVLPPAEWLKFALEFREKYWSDTVSADNWSNLQARAEGYLAVQRNC